MADALKSFARVVTRYERRDRFVECHARYSDPMWRQRCLEFPDQLPQN
jgi:hypothetical protein